MGVHLPHAARLLAAVHGFDALAPLARAAGAADVATTLEIWPDMIHAWPLWDARLEAGRRALARAGAFVRRHM